MSDALKLYPDRVLPLYPGDRLPLYPLEQQVDLLALRIDWEHHTFNGGGFGAARLRPLVTRLHTPGGGSLPTLIALTQIEPTGFETVVHSSSGDYGAIIQVDRYFRYKIAVFDPEIDERRTDWLRIRPEGAGIVYAHGLERQHMTWYEKNADTMYANLGVLVIGLNTAAVGWPLFKTIYPDLSRPEFDFYNHYDPPLPPSLDVPALVPTPAGLPSGDWRVELEHGTVAYNEGYRYPIGRPPQGRSGIAHMGVRLFTGVDLPLADITGGAMIRQLEDIVLDERGPSGIVPAQDYSWTLPLDFDSD